jgi:hypothetical protein
MQVLFLMAKVTPSVFGCRTTDGRTPKEIAQTPVLKQFIEHLEQLVVDSGASEPIRHSMLDMYHNEVDLNSSHEKLMMKKVGPKP